MRRHAFLPTVLLAGAALNWQSGTLMAQGVDMGPSECFSCGAAPSGPSYSAPQAQPQPSAAEIAAQQAQQARQQRLTEAHAANEQGLALYNSRDWDKALAAFQEAAAKNPDDPVIQKNLAQAQAAVAQVQAQLESQQRDKVAAGHMQEAIQGFAQTLKAAPASGGLDFDGGNSGSSPGAGTSGGLDFTTTATAANPALPPPKSGCAAPGSTMTVDACNVPSGLSKATEDAISGAYRDAPSGVIERVRKGFQAVATGDWNVARASFEDALNRDPGNASLQRMIVLADYSVGDKPGATSASAASPPPPPSAPPQQAEIDKFFRDFREGRKQTPTVEVRSYVQRLSKEEFKRLLWDMKPIDSDMEYLFDLNTPPSPQSESSVR